MANVIEKTCSRCSKPFVSSHKSDRRTAQCQQCRRDQERERYARNNTAFKQPEEKATKPYDAMPRTAGMNYASGGFSQSRVGPRGSFAKWEEQDTQLNMAATERRKVPTGLLRSMGGK